MTQLDLQARLAEARAQGRNALDEPTCKALLAAFGIEIPCSRIVGVDDEVRRIVAGLAPPFVLKVIAPGVLHKSDVGGVRLGLASADDLDESIEEMRANLHARGIVPSGWLVEQMVPRGLEVVVGGVTDPEFGPMVMVGLGGIFVEVFNDVAFRICPITERDAREMIEELRAAPLFHGVRGREPVAIDAIVHTLVTLGGESGLFLRCVTEIAEIDINPLIVTRDRAVAADARFVLRGTS